MENWLEKYLSSSGIKQKSYSPLYEDRCFFIHSSKKISIAINKYVRTLVISMYEFGSINIHENYIYFHNKNYAMDISHELIHNLFFNDYDLRKVDEEKVIKAVNSLIKNKVFW